MNSYRKYKVIKRVKEADLVVSLYLAPVDDMPLSVFIPGQHLMFRVHIPGHEIPVFRYYSFSDSFNPEYYRISVKKEFPAVNDGTLPEGLVSSYLFDRLKEGDMLEAKGPMGDFCVNPADSKPVALIAGGIGITPLLSMIKSIAILNPGKKVYFFYGVNGRSDHSFQGELQQLKTTNDNLRVTTFYARVGFRDIQGLHYNYEGFIDIKAIRQVIGEVHPDYYICGPGRMMNYITEELEKAGVNKNTINLESFTSTNEQGLDKEIDEPMLSKERQKIQKKISIEFFRSGKKVQWDNRYRSILEFAEENNIEINSGCLFGDCGTCLTEIKEGQVRYMHQTLVKVEQGKCLPCSCIPVSDLILNA